MEPALDLDSMEANADRAAAFLKSIAHRSRLLVLCHLMGGEMAAGAIGKTLGIKPANLSRHLTWLKREGLVETRRAGTVINYRLSDQNIAPLIEFLYATFCTEDKPKKSS